jgi:hypothetical protein
MVSHALKAIRWYFMWRIRSVANPEAESGVDEIAFNALREKRGDVVEELKQIIKQRPADEVKVQVILFNS